MNVLGAEKLLPQHQNIWTWQLSSSFPRMPAATQGVAAGAGNLDSLSALAGRISTSL
jgi:hypothetical protein